MSALIFLLLCLIAVGGSIKPLGLYMARVYDGKPVWLEKPLGWLEQLIYRLSGIDPKEDMTWRGYATALLAMGLFGFLLLFIIFSCQAYLPQIGRAHV